MAHGARTRETGIIEINKPINKLIDGVIARTYSPDFLPLWPTLCNDYPGADHNEITLSHTWACVGGRGNVKMHEISSQSPYAQ